MAKHRYDSKKKDSEEVNTSTSFNADNQVMVYALAYAKSSIATIPISGVYQGACTCGQSTCRTGKHPIAGLGSWTTAATKDPKKIREMFERYPHSNVAIPARDNNLVILDIDDALTFANIASLYPDALNTWQEQTGAGGYHIYYRQPANAITKNFRSGGIEVIANGYVVAAPSLHASGARYAWIEGHSPLEVPLADVPQAFFTFFKKGMETYGDDSPMSGENTREAEGQWIGDMIDTYVDKAISRRDDHRIRARMCFGLVRQLQSAGVPKVTAARAAREYARKVNRRLPKDHPFTESEAMLSVTNAYNMSPREPPRKQEGSP